jgi:glycine betaine/proline transport system permease protein
MTFIRPIIFTLLSLLLLTQPLRAVETAQDPWGNPQQTATADPWGPATAPDSEATTPDWLAATPAAEPTPPRDWLHPFQQAWVPLDVWVETGIDWMVLHFRPVFQLIRAPVDVTLSSIEAALLAVPSPIMIIILALLAWQLVSGPMALGTLISLLGIGLIGAWADAMVTLALVLTSLIFCLVLGLPTGIWLSRNPKTAVWVRPLLDAMQTTPAFVYLIPIVMLFGIGNVPGVVVTIIFALPPIIRLTLLGIQQVPEDLVEAAHSFGASPRQLLFKVQLPLAMPTIMAGVNQTLMLSLSMVVIASMIAVGGLGQMVLRGIGRLDMGMASVGGVGIVLLAIVLDRLTQAMGQRQRDKPATARGPLGLLRKLVSIRH